MKTDEYFYEFFRTHPAELLRLSGQKVSGPVHFESVTVKQRKRQEKRLDGLLTRSDGQPDRLIFAEFQGYLDRAIYWRALRSVAMYHEYLPGESKTPVLVMVIFLEKDHDPDFDLLTFNPPHQLLRIYLPEALERLEGNLGPLVVFKPLFAKDPEELLQQGPEWVQVIRDLKYPEKDRTFLIEALMYAMVQRFPTRDAKEFMSMFVLTPLEETVTVKNIIARSRAEGQAQGIAQGVAQGVAQGERIGQIHLLQQLLGRPITPHEELMPQSIEALDALVKQLKAEIH